MNPNKMLLPTFFVLITLAYPQDFLNVTGSAGQNSRINYERLDATQGLSENTVNCIFQDSRGFLWIGTNDGLNRYDGYKFRVYRSEAGDPKSLSGASINAIHEDRFANLWIGTFAGLNIFSRRSETFDKYGHDPDDPRSLSNDNINTIFEDRSGEIWIGTDEGVNRVSGNNGNISNDRSKTITERMKLYDLSFNREYQNPANPSSISHNHIKSIYEDRSGGLWFGTFGGGLNLLERTTGNFQHYSMQSPGDKDQKKNFIWAIAGLHPDSSGMMWIGTDAGLGCFDTDRKTFVQLGYKHNVYDSPIRALFDDHRGTLWVGSLASGLVRFTYKTNQDPPSMQLHASGTDLFATTIRSIYEDRNGILWTGTLQGLHKTLFRNASFRYWQHDPENANSLSNNYVWPIQETRDGSVWIGTLDGLNRLQRLNNIEIFSHWHHNPGNENGLSKNSILALEKSTDGPLWIGTFGGGLNRFDFQDGDFTRWLPGEADQHTISSGIVYALCEDREGMLWVGTQDGLDRFNPATGVFHHYRNDPTQKNTISYNHITTIFEDSSGTIWIGTNRGGLNRWNPETDDFTSWQSIPGESASLSDNTITAIHETKNEAGRILWVGTERGGLCRLDRTTNAFMVFGPSAGLPGPYVCGILSDHYGYLWISTENALSRFDIRTASFRVFGEGDGLPFTQFNNWAHCRSSTGDLFFGGPDGLMAFHPDRLPDEPRESELQLTDFRIFNRSIDIGAESPLHAAVGEVGQVSLSYLQNDFAVEFAMMDFAAPEKNRYSYMLEGYHSDWIDAGTRNFVSFTNLDPGKYRLRISGANTRGVWNYDAASLQIIITPPFWETWWFRLAVVSLLLGFVSLLYLSRLQNRRELQHARTRIAEDLHDEVSATLTSIRFFADAIDHERNALPADSQRYLGLINESADEAKDALGDIVWSINPENDRLDQFVARMRRYAADLLDSAGINCKLDMPENYLTGNLNLENRRQIWLVFKELLTNAVRHSSCTEISISFHVQRKQACLIIKDDGVGFNTEVEKGGNGLKNIRRRSRSLNSEIKVESEAGRGTRWEIRFRI